jgi:glucokinase
MAFLCVDVGGTNTLIGVGNGDFEVVEKISSSEFLANIEGCLENILEESQVKEIKKVAVAAAGPMDREKGVFYPPNIDMDEVDLRTPLSKLGNLMIINDCTSAVLGEKYYGGHDIKDLVYVTISSGIGAGIVVDGELIEGWNGNFGEIGHMKITDEPVKCGCGYEGHWEAFCSGNNLPEMAERLTGQPFEDAREVFEKAKDDGHEAAEAIQKMKKYNARGFANIVALFNPEKIVVGGAVALNHAGEVVDPLEKQVGDRAVNKTPEIELCALGDRSVLHGLRAVCNGKYKP